MDCQYKGLPKYPAVTRDIAMLVKDEVMVKEIEDIIKQRAGKILESVKLLMFTKASSTRRHEERGLFHNVQASDRTLTDEEVGKAMTKILDGLKRNLGAELR